MNRISELDRKDPLFDDAEKVARYMGVNVDDLILFTTEDDDADWRNETGGYFAYRHYMEESVKLAEVDEGVDGMVYRIYSHPSGFTFVYDTPSYDGAVESLWLHKDQVTL